MKQIVKITQQGEQYIQEPVELSKRETEILVAYIRIRDLYYELQNCEALIDEYGGDCHLVRSELNDAYIAFREMYGPLGKTRNRNIIDKDPYGFTVMSSVEVKMGHNEYVPADILTKSAKGIQEIYRTDNVTEALGYVMGMYGKVDLQMISDICDKEIDECTRELGDLIYWHPMEERWCTAEEWLSGNVWKKMIETRHKLQEYERETSTT